MRTSRPRRSSSKRRRGASSVDRVDKVFGALADATRRGMLEMLCVEARAATEFVRPGLSQPAVSRHLRVLKDAGLVVDRPAGNRRLYELDPRGVQAVRAYFEQFWNQALTAFKAAAERTDEEVS